MGAHTVSTAPSSAAMSRQSSSTTEQDIQQRIGRAVKLAQAETRARLVQSISDSTKTLNRHAMIKYIAELRKRYGAALLDEQRAQAAVQVDHSDAYRQSPSISLKDSFAADDSLPAISTKAAKRRRAKERKKARQEQADLAFIKAMSKLKVQPDTEDESDQASDTSGSESESDPDQSLPGSEDTDITVPKGKPARRHLLQETAVDLISGFPDINLGDDSEKRLVVWQSLCLELGIAKIGPHTEKPAAFAPVRLIGPRHFKGRPPYRLFATSDCLPDVPTTPTACKKLLHAKGHVNILEYCVARRCRMDTIERHRRVIGGAVTDDMKCSLNNQGAFADLVQHSAGAMVWVSAAKDKVVDRGAVKDNWFDPLLRTFN